MTEEDGEERIIHFIDEAGLTVYLPDYRIVAVESAIPDSFVCAEFGFRWKVGWDDAKRIRRELGWNN